MIVPSKNQHKIKIVADDVEMQNVTIVNIWV